MEEVKEDIGVERRILRTIYSIPLSSVLISIFITISYIPIYPLNLTPTSQRDNKGYLLSFPKNLRPILRPAKSLHPGWTIIFTSWSRNDHGNEVVKAVTKQNWRGDNAFRGINVVRTAVLFGENKTHEVDVFKYKRALKVVVQREREIRDWLCEENEEVGIGTYERE
ncbi:hypothetical protein K435DRAFT_799516 [Dendrothele bispora CBS 962.96]|uniref:Uncharacterized protein n=1 Tax=Dendrothele bispora (strain CBS 962.96) TaxID=1314807 RepID=A0A4S8LX22_DENBC|nr:hypothetical protein K435DRAFT_799516 [Dendrothele bispora CBS 962.96]